MHLTVSSALSQTGVRQLQRIVFFSDRGLIVITPGLSSVGNGLKSPNSTSSVYKVELRDIDIMTKQTNPDVMVTITMDYG